MNENEDTEMIETAKLLDKLTELDKRVRSQADDRHRVNGILHGTLNTLATKTENISLKTDMQDQVLSQIQDSVKAMSDSVRRVEVCLIGDPKFDRQGLIKDVIEMKAVHIALATRLSLAEDAAKANAAEIRSQKKMVLWTATVLAAIGGVITWLKNLFTP
jgi:hypothetical protein